jgi:hypothetical protein
LGERLRRSQLAALVTSDVLAEHDL